MTIPRPNLDLLFGPATTALCVFMLVIVLWNIRSMPYLRDRQWRDGGGRDQRSGTVSMSSPAGGEVSPPVRFVSLLVPARNEAQSILVCLDALLAQDHPNFEVIVLDDRSDDDTAVLVRSIDDPRLRLVSGTELPDGWTGKNWACHQLSQQARGDVLCFVDADTVLEASAVSEALAVMRDEDADLVTLLLAAEDATVPQAVLLPIVNFALLGLFPLALMHHTRVEKLALALGPFIMVTRQGYDAAGGHAASPGHVVDDVQLCRSVKATGRRVRLANGTAVARTRWYETTSETWNGFSKNAFGALNNNLLLAATVVLLVVPMLCAPFVRVGLGLLGGSVPMEVLIQMLLILAVRVVTAVAGRDPLWSVPLHPVAVVFWGAALAKSVVLSMTGSSVEWRGRLVAVGHRSRGGTS